MKEVNVNHKIEACPFCKKEAEIGSIVTPKTIIRLCGECHTCWEVRTDQDSYLQRLLRYRATKFRRDGTVVEEPMTKDNDLVCPSCWGKMIRNHETHHVDCPDPICHYSWRMPGISKKESAIKAQLAAHRQKVYELISKDEKVPEDAIKELTRLKEEYNKFRRYDETPI